MPNARADSSGISQPTSDEPCYYQLHALKRIACGLSRCGQVSRVDPNIGQFLKIGARLKHGHRKGSVYQVGVAHHQSLAHRLDPLSDCPGEDVHVILLHEGRSVATAWGCMVDSHAHVSLLLGLQKLVIIA